MNAYELNIAIMPDEEVIELAQSGDIPAIEEIISRYRAFVYQKSSGYYMSGYDKDDIIQEGLIGLYRAILDYEPKKSSFKTFAGLCISRKIATALKSTKRQKHIPLNMSVSLDSDYFSNEENSFLAKLNDLKKADPESILISNENLEHYQKLINSSLTKLEKKVFYFHLQGLSYKETAQILNKDIKSIDNSIQRIKRKLRLISTNV